MHLNLEKVSLYTTFVTLDLIQALGICGVTQMHWVNKLNRVLLK